MRRKCPAHASRSAFATAHAAGQRFANNNNNNNS